MAKTSCIPTTPWAANSTSPPADQNNQDGNRANDEVSEGQRTANEIFFWDAEDAPVGTLTNSTTNQPFSDINKYGGIITDITDERARFGTKSIRLGYPVNEAGVELKVAAFPATDSIYCRKWEYFDSNWATNWPVGLKTSRYYTTNNYQVGGNAYCSEKLIWQGYGGDADDLYARGLNNAVLNLDLVDTYVGHPFGDGNEHITTGRWYKFETYMVINSGDGVADGVHQVWIDDQLVYDSSTIAYVDTSRGVTAGLGGWQSMYYGGNYSGATFGDPSTTIYRYIDNMYLSTSLDR